MTAVDPRVGEIEARDVLSEIQERLQKANPLGTEWVALTDPGDRHTAPAWIVDADDLEVRLDATYAAGKVADFIAHSPSDVAYLLAELRKRDEALARVEAACADWAELADGDKYYARQVRAAVTGDGA